MSLRYSVVTTMVVDHGDLERFIEEIYGRAYEIPDGEEKCSGSVINDTLRPQPLSDWSTRKLGEFCQGKNPSYALRAIMQDLVNNGHILPGNYSIRISW